MAEYIKKEKLFDCLDIKNALGGHYGISLTAINAIPAADVVEYEEVENLLRWAVLHDWTWEEAQEHLQRLRAKMDGGADK